VEEETIVHEDNDWGAFHFVCFLSTLVVITYHKGKYP